MIDASAAFALLDDDGATAADPRSRLYTGHVATLSCCDAAELPALMERMTQALRQGLHAVGLFDYESGAQQHGIAPRSAAGAGTKILLFERCERFSSGQVLDWLDERQHDAEACVGSPGLHPSGIAHLERSVDEAEFRERIARIHSYIEAGDIYQLNYTYRIRFYAFGSLCGLYRRLRERQPATYGALIALPDGDAIMSLSPELFVRHEQGMLTAQPMKGTAAAGDEKESIARAAALAADEKNRAENLMIVDLLRNDLGRIANTGTVCTPKLFEVNRHGSVLQMTSTVQATMRDGVSLAEMLAALFPCGSITGAPKRRAMQIVRELESDARGLYCGAIGWFDAPRESRAVGDFCLSVAIRTLLLKAPSEDGIRHGELGVGAGIVHDSEADAEYAECVLKAQFLTDLRNGFELFETMHATRAAGCRHADLHLKRLRASAAYFGFACDEVRVRDALQSACDNLPGDGAYRLRLALDQAGKCAIQTAPLASSPGPVKIMIAAQPTDAADLFLRHKTTVRERYDDAWREAERCGAFDMLFFNTRGELTEGARSNVFIRLGGKWFTPPLPAGLLPGVMRSVVLADPVWGATEKMLTLQDLRDAEEIMVCNALRGTMKAILI